MSFLSMQQHKQDAKRYWSRALAMACIAGGMMLLLVARLIYLQVVQHKLYSTLSKQNILNIIPIEPPRGLIYDRNGVLLAKDVPVYSLDIIPARVNHLSQTISDVGKIIPLTKTERTQFFQAVKQHRPYDEVPLKLHLTEQQVAKIYVNQFHLPGVNVQTHLMREYPLKAATSSVVGYVGRINEHELSKLDNVNYQASDDIGKTGVEQFYEPILHGQVGAEEAEINANGRVVRTLHKIPPTAGDTLYLTIDSQLQAAAEKAMGKNAGAVIAMDPSTGEILAMVSEPNFDPNLFVNGISSTDYKKLLNAPRHPLYNRALRGLYSPGSTIKPFYALSALDNDIIDPEYKIFDRGWFQLPNTHHIYHDWKRDGHGWVNVHKAIVVSCDTFFYNLSVLMGINLIDHTLHAFGFGTKTHVDLSNELSGIVPSPLWKRTHQSQNWFTGDTVITGIGQGSLLTTPLQLAQATATLAMRGKQFQPHVLLKAVTPNGKTTVQQPIEEPTIQLHNPHNWDVVIRAMEGVVNEYWGTAIAFGRHPPFTVAAKTGTAQVYGHSRDEEVSRTNIPYHLRNNHLFISFAPVKHPKIVVVTVVEHASFADRIARKVMNAFFNEQKQEQPHG